MFGRVEVFDAVMAGSKTVGEFAVRFKSPSAMPNCDTCPALRMTLLLCKAIAMASSKLRSHQSSNSGSRTVMGSMDITASVKRWLRNPAGNHGVAVVPVVDRKVDNGNWGRFQVLGTEYGGNHTPSLTLEYAAP